MEDLRKGQVPPGPLRSGSCVPSACACACGQLTLRSSRRFARGPPGRRRLPLEGVCQQLLTAGFGSGTEGLQHLRGGQLLAGLPRVHRGHDGPLAPQPRKSPSPRGLAARGALGVVACAGPLVGAARTQAQPPPPGGLKLASFALAGGGGRCRRTSGRAAMTTLIPWGKCRKWPQGFLAGGRGQTVHVKPLETA